jgi:hypothetical protein
MMKFEAHDIYDGDFVHELKDMANYITQQEKKDKLLELKTLRIQVLNDSPYINRYLMSYDTTINITLMTIDNKIKELEEELKK